MSDQIQTYGGQAVIEGVMMRGSQNVAIAMRNPDQEIMNAVTVLIDRTMTIRKLRGEDEPDVTLEEIQALLGE